VPLSAKKLKYSLLILALGLAAGFAVTFWLVPNNGYIPENNQAGLGTAYLPEEYRYNLDAYKQVEPKLVLYKELPGFKTGFDEATGISVDGKDNVYICGDIGVKIFSISGKFLTEIRSKKKATAITVTPQGGIIYAALQDSVVFKDINTGFGKKGKGPGEFEYITSMKIIGSELYVADAGNRRVSVFDLTGKYLREFGKNDAKKGVKGFIIPSPHMDLAVDKDGSLWVGNTGRLRVDKYSKEGKFLSTWGKAGSKLEEFIGCCNPANFAIMSDGSFITSEKGLPRIKQYDKTGKFIGVVAPPSAFNEKCVNMAVAVDSKGKVYALDSVEKRVRIFQKN